MDSFLEQLPGVVKHRFDHEFDAVLQALLNAAATMPCAVDKLWIVLLGRRRGGDVVWANGNPYAGKYAPIHKVFEALDPSGVLWAEFHLVKSAHRHCYRAKTTAKGHSNDKPSYWALGFQTIDAYQAACSPHEWAAYKTLHKDCCGFFVW